MSFSSLMKDKISVFDAQGNLVASDQAASVQGGKRIITKTADFVVDVGYLVERRLPNGLVENYRVVEPNFMAAVHSFGSHYQMVVTNIKSSSSDTKSVTNNITLSDQASYYHNSLDNSTNTYNTYTLHQYKEALQKIETDVDALDLNNHEIDLIKNSLSKIESELKKPVPNKGVISTCISFLPTSIATLESVLNLAQMLGIP